MQAPEKRTLQAFRRVQAFLDANAGELRSATYETQRTMLDDVVQRLTAHAAEQAATRMQRGGSTSSIRALRASLRERHMRPITEIAQALLPNVPEISELRLPHPELDTEALLNRAGAIGAAAAPYAGVFVAHGRPADFLERLAAAASALKAVVDARGQAGSRGAGATQAIRAEVKRGRRAVRLIQAVIRPVILDDAKLLAEWEAAKRVGKRKGGNMVGVEPATTKSDVEPATTKADVGPVTTKVDVTRATPTTSTEEVTHDVAAD